jgi:hypothetical protein
VEQARERFAVGGTRGADANFGHGKSLIFILGRGYGL